MGNRLRSLPARMRARAADEHGTVLLIVAMLLTAMLGFGAYTIDIGSARAAQSKTQTAADAAAEAAASQIATFQQSGTTFTNATIAQEAQTVAVQNGFTNPYVTVNYPYAGDANRVQVIVRADAATSLGKESGRNSTPVVASAIAEVNEVTTTTSTTVTSTITNGTTSTSTITNTYTNTSTVPVTTTRTTTGISTSTSTSTDNSCASAGGTCMAIFAAQTGCGNTSVTMGGGTHVAGGVWSNGSLDIGGGGSSFGPLTYATGCSVTPAAGIDPGQNNQSNTFGNGYPVPAAPLTKWPLDYSTDFPSCNGSACKGPNGTPSYCTQASTASSWELDAYYPYNLTSGQIYCGVGSGTPSKPSTWNATLQVNGNGTLNYSTFVGGTINVGGGSSLAACGWNLPSYSSANCSAPAPAGTADWPLFYAVSGTVNESSGGNGLSGDWFVPNGSISVGGGTNFVGFLEAQTVNLSSGGIQGDGPSQNGSSVGTTHTTTNTTTTTGTTTGVTSTLSSSTTTSKTTTSSVTYGYTPTTSVSSSTLTTPDGSKLTG